MSLISQYLADAFRNTIAGWNRFWFTPRDPAVLGLIRIATGLMFLYINLVWLYDWQGFFGENGWLNEAARSMRWENEESKEIVATLKNAYWSHFHWIKNANVLLIIHWCVIAIGALLTVGLFSRVMAPLAWLFTLSYTHRTPFANFGLDSIMLMLTMYLMIGPSGDAFSIDRWWKRKKSHETKAGEGSRAAPIDASVGSNIAIRLIQLHMCLIYLLSAVGKLQGETWVDGSAIWISAANLEYQSADFAYLAAHKSVSSFLSYTTVLWELAYCVLVWPRLWRPAIIALAIPLHLGIGLFMGMMTFGLIMLVANFAFVEPWIVRSILAKRK
jgi:uncharacterized membrane protein YphA (DoxX/SURF4 family)